MCTTAGVLWSLTTSNIEITVNGLTNEQLASYNVISLSNSKHAKASTTLYSP